MLRKFFAFVVLLLITVASLTAQRRPPQGTGIYYDLISPVFLAGGDNTVSSASPSADFLNPATSALTQRTTIDVSYLTLTGTPNQKGRINRAKQDHCAVVILYDQRQLPLLALSTPGLHKRADCKGRLGYM